MKHLITLVLCLTLAASAWAQEVLVKGRITDQKTGEPLPGATVQMAHSASGAVTDLDGTFALRVPATGVTTLQVNYLGYQAFSFEVNPAEKLYYETSLTDLEVALQEVVVYGQLQGQQKALNQQMNAGNIRNVVAADQIGRFPDPNVAEALQRIPGTTLQRDQGEGRYVIVRGLSPQFTNISINGEQIPSPESGVRFVALDAIPADQLASMEVSKALTPDLDGDAIGGSVNLITRKAKSRAVELQGTAVGGYNALMGAPNAQGSLLFGRRLGDMEQFGILLNGSYYTTDRGSDNWERDGDEIELRDYQLRRTRTGASATLDYRFTPNHEIYLRGIYNSFTDREWRRRYVMVPNVDDSPFEDHEIERLTKDRFEMQNVTSVNLGGKHAFAGFGFNYEVAWSEAFQDTPFDYEVNFIAEPDALALDFSNPNFPAFSTNADFDYLDNSNYEFDELETGSTYALDRNLTGKFNVWVPYSLANGEGQIKFGAKYRAKTKSFTVTQNKFEWAGDGIVFDGQEGDFTAEKFVGGLVDSRFLGGQYVIGAAPDMGRVLQFFNANTAGFELQVEDKLVDEANESYLATENVLAGYAMTDLTLGKLQVVGGVRYERTTVDYQYNTVFFDDEGDLDEIVEEEGATAYDFVLPQLNLRYKLGKLTNLRGAATLSYARPNFESIVPSQEIDLSEREGSIGNANLQPVSALNLDLMVDHYFGTVGVLSAGLFHKRLDNFIYKRVLEVDAYNGVDFDRSVRLVQDVNGEQAALTGLELAYQQNLTFLPGALAGIGVYGNFTYTISQAELVDRAEVGEVETIRLPGQSPVVANLSLSYDWKGFNTRLSGNYHGDYILELGEAADEDVWVHSRLQLDWTASYRIGKRITVFGEVMNLNNAPFQAYIGERDSYIQREFYAWWSRAGIKFNL